MPGTGFLDTIVSVANIYEDIAVGDGRHPVYEHAR